MPLSEIESRGILIGEVMRRLRRQRGMSLEEVALRMGKKPCEKTQIASWERAEISVSAEELLNYLVAIDVTFANLDRELRPLEIIN